MRAVLTALILALPMDAFACACCSDPGQRFSGMVPMEDYERAIFDAVAFDGPAHLHSTACGFECVRGIAEPEDTYHVTLTREGWEWRLDVTGQESGATGTLGFTLPSAFFAFVADPSPDFDHHTPVLYKERRITVALSASGLFAPAMAEGAPAATFILHGQGNSCPSDADYTNWTLQVQGPAADFTLFGKLSAE